jgi:hypothetical protein
MTTTITGLFDRYEDARTAVSGLEAAGIPSADISLVANGGGEAAATEDAGKGAGIGAAVGGVGGLLTGLGMMAIPGIGPVVAAGWLTTTAAGAVAGAVVGGAAGGIIGALTEQGVSEADAHVYAESVRRGGALVTARVDDGLADQARAILRQGRTVDIAGRRKDYESEGWVNFDENAPIMTSDVIQPVPDHTR